jgi:hypothetical protein
MLLGQHLLGRRHAVHLRQLDGRLYLQAMRRNRPAVLLDFLVVVQLRYVQGSHEPVLVQQHDGLHLQKLWGSGRNLLLGHHRESHRVQGCNRRLR